MIFFYFIFFRCGFLWICLFSYFVPKEWEVMATLGGGLLAIESLPRGIPPSSLCICICISSILSLYLHLYFVFWQILINIEHKTFTLLFLFSLELLLFFCEMLTITPPQRKKEQKLPIRPTFFYTVNMLR